MTAAALPPPAIDRVIGRCRSTGAFRFAVLIKRTFAFEAGRLLPRDEQEPVLQEMIEAPVAESEARVPIRMAENLPEREACDVIVLATARSAKPITEQEIVVRIGSAVRKLIVRGDRYAERRRSSWIVSPPQPWEQMPLTWDRAYGGVDPSVSPDSFDNAMDLLSASVIYPGAYPRNDLGRGYRVARRSASSEDSIRLPNLELPDDQITVDRLECRQSSAWHRQPRPAGFGFVLPHWFPRSLHVGVIAGPWPDLGAGPLPEEVLGLLPSGFLDAQRAQKEELSVSPGFLQVSAPGMAFPDLTGVESMALEGLDGNRHLELTLPGGRPAAALQLAKGRLDLAARLLQIVLEVDSAVLTMLWSASVALDDPHVVGIPSAELLALPVAVI